VKLHTLVSIALLSSLPACSTATSEEDGQNADALQELWTPTVRTLQRGNTVEIGWDPQRESAPGSWQRYFFWKHAIVEYGTSSDYGQAMSAQPGYGNAPSPIVLTNLTMGASYHYRIKFFREYGTEEGSLVWTSPDASFTVAGTLVEKTITGDFRLTAQGSPYWFAIPDKPAHTTSPGFPAYRPSDACIHGTMTAEPGAVIEGAARFTADCSLELHGTEAAPVSIRGGVSVDAMIYDSVSVSLRHVDASEGHLSIRARGPRCEIEDSIIDRGESVLDTCVVRNNTFLPAKASDGYSRLLMLQGAGVFTNNWVGERGLRIEPGARALSGNAFVVRRLDAWGQAGAIDLSGNYWGLDCRPLNGDEPCGRIAEKLVDNRQGGSVSYLPYLQDAPTGLPRPAR
jgi:hypothetical protein